VEGEKVMGIPTRKDTPVLEGQTSLVDPVYFDEQANRKQVWDLRQYLLDTMYTTYARLMSVYPVRFDADISIAPAYTDGKAIHIAKGMNLAEQSLAVRHELLHILLHHRDESTWRKGQKDHMIRNIAGDAELSNYYDDEDNLLFSYDGPLQGGINVHVNQGQWKGKDAPTVYALVAKKAKQDKSFEQAMKDFMDENPFGDCVPKGTPDPKATGTDPVTGQPSSKGAGAGEIGKDEAERILEELLETTTRVSHSPFAGKTTGDLGTVGRTKKEAETKLYVSLTRYFSHATDMGKRSTYASPNKRSTATLIKRGRRRRPVESKTLVMYIDRSGSMTDEKTGKADKIVENTVKRLRDVTVVKKYFANRVGDDPEARNLGGGTNYAAIRDDIRQNGYQSVAIVTDNDSSNICGYSDPHKDWGNIKVDMAWICAVECNETRVANNIESRKTVLEVAI
jgi:hypothetical protein